MAHRKRWMPFRSILMAVFLLMGLSGCRADPVPGQTTTGQATQATPTVTSAASSVPSVGEPSTAATTISGAVAFPFPTPDFAPVVFDRGRYLYPDVTPAELDDYLSLLHSHGFSMQKYEYCCYLQKNNVFIEITDNTKATGTASLVYFLGLPETRPGTLSPTQAQVIIGEDSLSIMEMMVPDLYEKTGAQLFYTMSRETLENNQLRQYLILNDQAFLLETLFQAYQVFDIDEDGHAELLAIIPGRTSGLFSFGIEVVGFDGGHIYIQDRQYAYPLDFSFLVLQADADAAYVFAAVYKGAQLSPTTALYRLTYSEGTLVFVPLLG